MCCGLLASLLACWWHGGRESDVMMDSKGSLDQIRKFSMSCMHHCDTSQSYSIQVLVCRCLHILEMYPLKEVMYGSVVVICCVRMSFVGLLQCSVNMLCSFASSNEFNAQLAHIVFSFCSS